MTPNTVEIWRGPSEIDGAPIVLVASGLRGTSDNRKTGAMAQTWVLRQDQSPVDAVRSGADSSICGACQHRGRDGFAGRTCYVNVGQAPASIWRSWKRGTMPIVAHPGARLRHPLRLGAYGDPLAVPLDAWRPWVDAAADIGRTGYTHQWATIGRRVPEWARYVMASCDSAAEAMLAWGLGWRTFRVHRRDDAAPIRPRAEVECVAESHGRTCAECRLCFGSHPSAPSIRIAAHGAGAGNFGR